MQDELIFNTVNKDTRFLACAYSEHTEKFRKQIHKYLRLVTEITLHGNFPGRNFAL